MSKPLELVDMCVLRQEIKLYSSGERVCIRFIGRAVARLGIEGGRDISQAGPDMFVTYGPVYWIRLAGGYARGPLLKRVSR